MRCNEGQKVRIRFVTILQWAPYCTLPKECWTGHACHHESSGRFLRALVVKHCNLELFLLGSILRIVKSEHNKWQCIFNAEFYLGSWEGSRTFINTLPVRALNHTFCVCQSFSKSELRYPQDVAKLIFFLHIHCHRNQPSRLVYRPAILACDFLRSSLVTFAQHVAFHPTNGCRIGEASNPGPDTDTFLLKCCLLNPTAIYNKVDVITKLDCQIYQVAENSATAAIQTATQPEFRRQGFQTHWSPPVAAHAGVSIEETSYRGQATGVSIHSLFPLRPSRVKLQDDIDHTRILSSIVQLGDWKIHLVTIYGYPSCHQKSKERTNALVEAAAMMIDQVNLPSVLAGDFNHPLETLAAGQTFARCGFVSLKQKFQELYSHEMPPTCRDVTSPDQVIISSSLQQYISAVVVDKQKDFSDHDPILYQFHLPIQPPMQTVWRLPKSWLPFQPDKMILESEFVRIAKQHNLPLTPQCTADLMLWNYGLR